MADPLISIKNRVSEEWLIGYDSRQFVARSQQLFQELTEQTTQDTPPKILLAEPDPERFLAGFIAATAANCPIFLCNPNWVKDEWHQVFELVKPDLIWTDLSGVSCPFSVATPPSFLPAMPKSLKKESLLADNRQTIMIPTGGSSGQTRFAIHTWDTLMASVQGFTQYFQVSEVNSFCVLPVYHVSGLMQFMRSLATGGKLAILPFKELEAGVYPDINPGDFFISLVPTQLQRLLQNPAIAAWLSRFKTVLLGGAPAWPELLQMARQQRIPLALTYGMTETASQIATLKAADFLNGDNSCGQVLPHAKITICSPTGQILSVNQTGTINIQASSLALGYYAETNLGNPHSKIQTLKSDDLGFFDDRGYLNIVGRSSDKIITGGENVFAAEVEAAILATGLVADVCVLGISDHHWGQVVAAVYIPLSLEVLPGSVEEAIADKLAKFKRPKYWLPVKKLPRNPQGKVNREQLKQFVIAQNVTND